MTRLAFLCWAAAVAITAFVAFRVSVDTQELEARAVKVKGEIVGKLEAIHVLEAEWSYLNQPDRIADLARRRLGMADLSAAHMTGIDELGRLPGEEAADSVSLRPTAEVWQ